MANLNVTFHVIEIPTGRRVGWSDLELMDGHPFLLGKKKKPDCSRSIILFFMSMNCCPCRCSIVRKEEKYLKIKM